MREPLSQRANGFIQLEDTFHQTSHGLQVSNDPLAQLPVWRPHAAELECQQTHGGELRGKCLRRRDANLEACPRIDDAIRLTSYRAADDVADRQYRRSVLPGVPHGRKRVSGLA